MVNATFLRLSVLRQREPILTALKSKQFKTFAYLRDLPVSGMPGVSSVTLFAWPIPVGATRQVGVDVVCVDQQDLAAPVSVTFDLHADEQIVDTQRTVVHAKDLLPAADDDPRPARIRLANAVWHLCAAGQRQEVYDLDAQGQPIFRTVDTAEYCYRLVCPRCGRERYAKRKSIHQIIACWVCTRQDRLRRRALSQYKKRQRTGTRPRRLLPHEIEAAIAAYHENPDATSIARRFNVTPSAMFRLLKRHGAIGQKPIPPIGGKP